MSEPLVEILVRYFYEDESLMVSELSRAIESINGQMYKNLMVTFCRDGGLDAYETIKDKCLVERRTIGGSQNMDRGFATNCLLTTLRGDYFGLLDSDDHIEPGYVARCVEEALAGGLVMIKPKVKLVYFKVEREKTDLFEMYFRTLIEQGDAFYRQMFGKDSIKIFAEGLQMISKVFHRCMSALMTRSDMNITEDCYWMYKANRIVKELGLKVGSYSPAPGEHYVQVHPLNRMERYEKLGLKMKAEDYYELPTEEDLRRVKDAVAKGLRCDNGNRAAS
jgi:glycosyltransferase involved in cell wall biosynthesis